MLKLPSDTASAAWVQPRRGSADAECAYARLSRDRQSDTRLRLPEGPGLYGTRTRRWRGQDSNYESLPGEFVEPMIKTGTGNFSTSLGIARSRTTCSKSHLTALICR